MPTFEDFGALKLLANRIKQDIDAYSRWKHPDDLRDHLGASEIGEECWRRAWLKWRWAKQEDFSGRMRRLFRRGHEEELKFLDLLRGIGLTVWDIDPETNTQFRVIGVQGHFGGSCDGFGVLPPRYEFPPLTMLCEFKTHNTKSFRLLVDKGVMISKPKHWAQMCAYGWRRNAPYALYCAVNKDDDDLHFEVLKLDFLLGEDTERKAEELIFAKTPPRRIAETPAFHVCKRCVFTGICYDGERPQKNCRSCVHVQPVDGGKWFCTSRDLMLERDWILQGCDRWKAIING